MRSMVLLNSLIYRLSSSSSSFHRPAVFNLASGSTAIVSQAPSERSASPPAPVPGWDRPLTACTRSKMPLTDRAVKELEASWQPPDISPDMYEAVVDPEMDREYVEFLQSIFGPDSPKEASEAERQQQQREQREQREQQERAERFHRELASLQEAVTSGSLQDSMAMVGGQDEDDPEFNVMAEPDDVYRDDFLEDLRNDKTVRVPKRELRELFDDLYDIVTVDAEPMERLTAPFPPKPSPLHDPALKKVNKVTFCASSFRIFSSSVCQTDGNFSNPTDTILVLELKTSDQSLTDKLPSFSLCKFPQMQL